MGDGHRRKEGRCSNQLDSWNKFLRWWDIPSYKSRAIPGRLYPQWSGFWIKRCGRGDLLPWELGVLRRAEDHLRSPWVQTLELLFLRWNTCFQKPVRRVFLNPAFRGGSRHFGMIISRMAKYSMHYLLTDIFVPQFNVNPFLAFYPNSNNYPVYGLVSLHLIHFLGCAM